MTFAVILHNIRSAHNVGSIFRTSDAAGAARIFLTGYTPLPTDAYGRVQKDIAKTALGAQMCIPWSHHISIGPLVRRLKKEGFEIVGVEQDVRAIDYRLHSIRRPTAFILGNEVRGISKSVRDACDTLVEIPMRGTKESLNVSVAAGIVLFQSTSGI